MKKAVILGNCHSIFVRSLAEEWARRGLDVVIVTRETLLPEVVGPVRIISARFCWPVWTLPFRVLNPVLRWLERRWPVWFSQRYLARTGKAAPEPFEHFWVDSFWDAFACARIVRQEQPDFVFGQDVAAYGFSTALCTTRPRVLFPWGADIFFCVETSPFLEQMMRCSIRRADLIVPTSGAAKSRLVGRLAASPDRIVPLSWGVDVQLFRRATPEQRDSLMAELEFPADSVVIMNCRRFLPLWGAHETLAAFVEVAKKSSRNRFILLAGAGTDDLVDAAIDTLNAENLQDRFYFAKGNVSLVRCAQLMSVADIAVSLLGTGDMRSSSVLQAVAAGAVPVLAESDEYRAMQQQGFRACFAERLEIAQTVRILHQLTEKADLRDAIQASNRHYIEENEDSCRQMDKILGAIQAAADNCSDGLRFK